MTQLAALKWDKVPITSDADTKLDLNVKNHAVVHHNGILYLLGGSFEDSRMDVILYKSSTKAWTRVKHQSNGSSTSLRRRFNFRRRDRDARTETETETDTDPLRDEVTMTGDKPHFRNGHTATKVIKVSEDNVERVCIYVIGGWLGNRAASEVLVLDITNPKELKWSQAPDNGVSPGACNMHSAEYVPDKREIYVFRGGDGSAYLNDLHAFHVDTMLWRKVEMYGALPEPRADHASAYMHETKEMFVFGGWNGSTRLNDFYILDTVTSKWSRPEFKGSVPHARAGMTLSAVRDRLYLFGGNGVESSVCNDLHVFDRTHMEFLESVNTSLGASQHSHDSFDSNRPSPQITTNPNSIDSIAKLSVHGHQPSKRAGHSATVVGRYIYIIGGSSGSEYRNDCYILDTDNLILPPESECQSFRMMSSQLKGHFNTEDLADVVFMVEGKQIFAHKIVLSLTSEVYRAMFLNNCKEKSAARPEIEVANCSYDNFLSVLEYMYTGEIALSLTVTASGEIQSFERILSILEIADHLLLDHLKQRCERALFHAVNATSIDYLMQFAQHSNAKHLEAMCSHYERNKKMYV